MFGMDVWVTVTGALLVWAGGWSCFAVLRSIGTAEKGAGR